MKKFIVALSLLTLAGTAMAQHYHGHGLRHHGHYGHRGHGWWVAPVVIGAIGYELGRQQTVVVQQPQPVIIHQSERPVTCTEWKEIQTSDGRSYRERTCTQ